ncbi:hypothetical protein S58_61700 [Bradyrhizobium oligotrophicum S58]|uniref:Uncharacterized protein n=1 Tax=Bradyrhizobium oligotrophicum S58 TaxID=1245469 RepID=M4ZEI5_9BRAD|nr:hypothetical protein S58_61700 [Bradyrhizobium oligotrophicum S58]
MLSLVSQSTQRNSDRRMIIPSLLIEPRHGLRIQPCADVAARSLINRQLARRADDGLLINPWSHSNSKAFTLARLRNAAPCALRHIEQWQLSARDSAPLILYLTRPHRQLPWIMLASLRPQYARPFGARAS